MSSENVFISAVLTRKSQKALLRKIRPKHSTVYAHHVTMAFKPGPVTLKYYRRLEGKRIRIPIIGVATNKKAQAVLVGAETENKFPHITISVAEGIEARYSNDLFLEATIMAIPVFTVEAKVVIEPLT